MDMFSPCTMELSTKQKESLKRQLARAGTSLEDAFQIVYNKLVKNFGEQVTQQERNQLVLEYMERNPDVMLASVNTE